MVLKAQIGGYDISRVFMDAGSEINIIYLRTLQEMNISDEFLQPTNYSIHGFVPGSANYSMGRTELDVCFSDQHNFKREKLEFEVMDRPSHYHEILGRPTFACFMAVSHYTYLVLKILGPNGGNHSQRKFQALRYMQQRIPQNGSDLQHDSRICKNQR
jgi:hypothetical protein